MKYEICDLCRASAFPLCSELISLSATDLQSGNSFSILDTGTSEQSVAFLYSLFCCFHSFFVLHDFKSSIVGEFRPSIVTIGSYICISK